MDGREAVENNAHSWHNRNIETHENILTVFSYKIIQHSTVRTPLIEAKPVDQHNRHEFLIRNVILLHDNGGTFNSSKTEKRFCSTLKIFYLQSSFHVLKLNPI